MRITDLTRYLLHNWRAKLGSLAVGFILWLMLKLSIEPDFFDHTFGPWRP